MTSELKVAESTRSNGLRPGCKRPSPSIDCRAHSCKPFCFQNSSLSSCARCSDNRLAGDHCLQRGSRWSCEQKNGGRSRCFYAADRRRSPPELTGSCHTIWPLHPTQYQRRTWPVRHPGIRHYPPQRRKIPVLAYVLGGCATLPFVIFRRRCGEFS